MGELELSNKQKRRNERRLHKYRIMLLKETGIEHSDEPSKNLMICNAGLVCGVGESDVVEIFSQYGQLESVTMLIGKSYSFVSFKRVIDAAHALENVTGVKSFPKMKGPIYLMFTLSVPDKEKNLSSKLPKGLHVIENFVSETEEDMLLKCIDWSNTSDGKSLLKHRRVKHYGYEFNYKNNNVDKCDPLTDKIPDECMQLFDKLKKSGYCTTVPWIPDQLTINEYQPGQGIPSHVDTHSAFESPIISLSLGSNVVMEFKHRSGLHIPVLLPQRSLLIMDGESRYDWTHGITPRKLDVIQSPVSGLIIEERRVRTSFTFRKIRQLPCNCSFPVLCDSQQNVNQQEDNNLVISNSDASRLENVHVHQVYNEISTHFSETRFKPWPNVASFVNSLPVGSFLVDVGCGNGKYLGANKNIFEVGCDRSNKLCEECHERRNEVFTCDCLQLPLRSNCADGVISIAVIHHLATYERRLYAINEIVRILRTGGQGLVYVWAKEQLKDKSMSTYLKQDRKNRQLNTEDGCDMKTLIDNSESEQVDSEFPLPVHKNRTQFKHEDVLVPWKLKSNKETVYYRFYHVFKDGELENMIVSINNVKVLKSYYDQGNWGVHFEKLST